MAYERINILSPSFSTPLGIVLVSLTSLYLALPFLCTSFSCASTTFPLSASHAIYFIVSLLIDYQCLTHEFDRISPSASNPWLYITPCPKTVMDCTSHFPTRHWRNHGYFPYSSYLGFRHSHRWLLSHGFAIISIFFVAKTPAKHTSLETYYPGLVTPSYNIPLNVSSHTTRKGVS